MAELPVDKDYAWFVAVGAFINMFISLGTYRVYGVIFVEVLDYYDTSSALSSTMFGIFMLTCALSLVLHTVIVNKVTERTLCFCAGVSFGLSLILQVFSPNVYYFIIIFGVLGGIGSTFTMYTAIISLSTYFRERLSLASGLAFTGSSIGQLVIPQLMDLVFKEYDLKGAMLILGGIQLHPIVSAMLFRPRSFYERTKLREKRLRVDVKVSDRGEIDSGDVKSNQAIEGNKPLAATELTSNKTNIPSTNLLLNDSSHSHASLDSDDKSIIDGDGTNTDNKTDGSCKDGSTLLEKNIREDKSNSDLGKSDSVEIMHIAAPPAELSLQKSLHKLCTSPRFFLFTCGRCFSVLAMYLVILFLPPYARDNGCTMSQVTLMLTVVGACDLPSRPFHGWIVSFKIIDATYYVGATTLVASVVIFICIFMPSYASIMVMGIGQGVFYNPVLCLMNVIMIDSVGQALFPRAMMLTMMTMYGAMTFLPTIFGMMYDTLGSYLIPMCISAGCGILGGVLTIVERKTRPNMIEAL